MSSTSTKPTSRKRPPFLVSAADVPETQWSYPGSDEKHHFSRAIGRKAGLLRIGLHLGRLAPGQRTSWPHAESGEEEFAYVIDGECDAWIDGELHHMVAGDLAAFPAGTGISHTFLNNGTRDCLLLYGGEADKADAKITYPLHPSRREQLPWSRWWEDAPPRKLGPHDGLPDAQRRARKKGVTG